MGKNVASDDEVELEVDEDGEPIEEEDEEDDDEGQDEYENDGFIVDDVEDEEVDEESDEERRKKKKKRKKKEAEDLDEDDYELLRENDVNVPKGSKKFKRLKKAQRDLDERFGLSDDEFDGNMKGGRTAEEKLKRTLFGDDDDIPEDEGQIDEEEDGDMGEEDEMADFIVEEDDVPGASVRRKKMSKKSRHAFDVSSSALKEAQDIFGDVDELLLLRKQGLDYSDQKERRLEDQFEPTVLSEKYMTEKDDEIRMIDIPERMLISEESTGSPPTDEESIIEEGTWVHKQLTSGAVPLFGQERTDISINKDDIMRFLDLTHVQKLDIPFIAMYRKELCLSLLQDPEPHEVDDVDQDNSDKTPTIKWHRVLWAIRDLDRKWLLLQKRKSGLRSHYNKRFEEESRRIYDETKLNLNQQLFESILKDLEDAESEREVDDVDAKFNLHFPPGEVGVDEGPYKRPKRRSQYSSCYKAGLWEVASNFGYSAQQLGSQLSLEKLPKDELEDPKETPEEMASNFTCAMFETPQSVLKGSRHMAALEISCEPSVKKYVRKIYMKNAVVSTCPTSDGKIAIDSFHPFAGVKWLREKPLSKFEDAQWLLIQKAEEEKLLQVTFNLLENFLDDLIKECNERYLSNGVSRSAQQWNEQRKQILNDALFSFLLPSMEKEARSLLASRAKSWLRLEYGKGLWNKVSVGPYQRKENDSNSDEEAAPRVMACCWGPGKPATTFVMLDSSGEVLDVLYTGSLTFRSQNVNDQQCKKNDQQRVLKFMTDHQPHIVVLGAVNLSCTRLKDDIYEIIFKMVEENPRDVGHEMDELSIVYGDESLPRLYENSRISADQLPGTTGIVKRAVALGRYLQNPLAMVATLCGPEKEILSWKLNPLENFLTSDEKYSMIEQVLVDVTNQVGLDVNLAASHEWLFAPLQFISGLGSRKAASLQRSLLRVGTIFSRKDFVQVHGLGKKVFVNAAAFLRVRRSGLAANGSQFIDLLDDTRIHPESYLVAQELAKDVYDEDFKGDNEDDDALEMAIEHVRDRPSLLKSLRIDNYLESKKKYLESKKRDNLRETFYDIKRELIHGFQDWRKPYKEPSQDEEFYLISGETEDTLAEGRILQATIRRVQGGRAICALESGLTGMIMKEDYADDWGDIAELSDRLHEGDILTCKIKSIQKNRYQVFLVCKDSEMRSNRHQQFQNLDPYYHEERSSIQSDQEKALKEREMAKKHFKPRMIVHPRFQNITADEAMEYLSDKDPGESIFRPSSRGPSFLTLTLKVYDGVYAHKDIVEGGKEHKDITSLLRIGKILKIGEDTFEDLDEVMDRYVDPLVSHLKAMLSYRKFRKGTKAEIDELLRVEKSEHPMRIVYCFGISHEHPGTFILTYIRSSNPHHEYIGLYPKGFKFRKRMFEDVDRLVAYFQKHIDDPPHESAPSIRSVAAMVPMRSPAGGGSSGASSDWGGPTNDGGWGDGDQSSTPGRGRDRHPSGAPRPYGERGRGRGRGRGGRGRNERQDSSYGDTPKWESGSSKKGDDDGWGSFPGAKVQNSPGREAFPGGWGASGTESGSGNGGSSGWGGGGGGGWGASGTKNGSGKGGGSGVWGTSGTESGSGGSGGGGWGASGAESGSGKGGGGGWGASGTQSGSGKGGSSGVWGASGIEGGSGGSGWGGGSGGWGASGTQSGSGKGGGGGGWGASGTEGGSGGSGGWGASGTKGGSGGSGGWGASGTKGGSGGSGEWGASGTEIESGKGGGGWGASGTESGNGKSGNSGWGGGGGGGWGASGSGSGKGGGGGGWGASGTESGSGKGGGGWGASGTDSGSGKGGGNGGWGASGTESGSGKGGGGWGASGTDSGSGKGGGNGGWGASGTESGSGNGRGCSGWGGGSNNGGSGWGSAPKSNSSGGW
ncbi:4-alpha-glucanotransferase DPE2-like isoform X1 [Hibiscus syriacus]|uniref:4-alpha-glucanotransferase DPE2-like isoform X1 n=1 Tax=Hibiscus syriacus TaxID=106335 RepID=A0A6A3C6G1_HIBSY|nr:transcription elongation factor SPT6 homolog [Hibiscus syriacus]KAE8724314.1 4-alpha-glucanotransferase DPE2-like isoform X1 [Hibiscus syriacus]